MPVKARVESVDLSSVAQELYSLTPDKFIARRNERAKSVRAEDGELAKRILSLPKPSAAAWAVNLLVRERGDEVDQLLSLGNLLREAQDDLDSESLRELSGQRRKLVAALGQQAVTLAKGAGQNVSASTREDVEQTLQAAMTDPRAAAAARTGRLTRALHAAGLEPVDLAEAVAAPDEGMLDAAGVPTTGTAKDRAERPHTRARVSKRKLSEARQKAADAAQLAEQEATKLAAIDERAADIDHRRRDLISKLDGLKSQISAVEDEIASTDRDGRLLERERDKAARVAEDARGRADRAQKQVDTLL